METIQNTDNSGKVQPCAVNEYKELMYTDDG